MTMPTSMATLTRLRMECKGSPSSVLPMSPGQVPYRVHRTLAISCEGRTTSPWFTMTLPTTMPPPASNRPSSAASRCWTAPYTAAMRYCGATQGGLRAMGSMVCAGARMTKPGSSAGSAFMIWIAHTMCAGLSCGRVGTAEA